MNFTYIKTIAPAAALVLTLGMSSCVKDLDVTPIDPNNVSELNEVALYTKCYANMALAGNTGANGDCDVDKLDGGTTGFVRQLWNANELTTDEAICAWGDTGIPAFNFNEWDADHPMLYGFYSRLYAGIAYCNHYLEECSGVDKTRTAEVRFLRALYYYHLMDCFGNVPFADKLSTESPKQMQRAALFKWIEDELVACKDNMLESKARTSKDEGYGRADIDAANLLLARMYLNAEVYTGKARWQEAKDYADNIITKGKHALWTDGKNGWSAYQMLFMGDNGESGASCEAILPLLQDGLTTTSWGTSLFVMASAWKADMDVNSNYGTTEFWAGNRARSQFIAKFFPNGDAPQVSIQEMAAAAKDDRALFHGIDRELVVTTPTEYTSGYAVGKYRNTYSTGATPHNSQFVDTDYFLMRSAEAYLIYAEADARLNAKGETDITKIFTTKDGTGMVNKLRHRAHAVEKDIYSLQEILDERSRELYFEGFRRTDLIRFGRYHGTEYLWDWKGGVAEGRAFPAHLDIFALPKEDVNANVNLKQNDGYK